jgi:branched-chain amino acid aminotransferase
MLAMRSAPEGADLSGGAAFIDGEIVPIGEAETSLLDRGFLRADATYDVVGVWDGAFFRLQDHLDRFQRSCSELRLQLPYSREEIESILIELVARSGLRSAYVDMICTRGIPPGGSRDPRDYENRFYAYAVPYIWLFRAADEHAGMDAVIARTVRRIPPDSVDPTVKNFHWGDLTKALYEAYDRGAHYPILLDHAGNVTEGPGYNLFALVDGRLLTPISGILLGVTRRTVMELAQAEGIEVEEVELDEETFRRANELFATSTAGGVMPITSLDGKPVGDGRAGELTRRLRHLYWEAHSDPRYTTPVEYAEEVKAR